MATPSRDYSVLVKQVHQLEQQLEDVRRESRLAAKELEKERVTASKRLTLLKTLQTLNLGFLSSLSETNIYSLACQSVVHQMGWDAAFVVSISGGLGRVLAHDHATEKQLNHLKDHVSHHPVLTDAYAHQVAIVTHHGTHDQTDLQIRSLFHAEEVAAMPIKYGELCYGYLVAVESHAGNHHTTEEIDFLAGVASLLAHAVQQAGNVLNLEAQNEKLRALDELKDSFISITSHQLRTPLSIIKWVLSILQTDKELATHTEQLKLIGQAYETNERLIHVVNDLLNVSRIQEGKLPYKPQPGDLSQFVQELCANVQSLLSSHGIELRKKLADDLPVLNLDPILFKEALQNLLDNAIDYNLEEGGWIEIETARVGDKVELRISNSGKAIEASELPKIFQQFYRSEQAVQQHPNGNGLGLYLARAIVHEHGGSLACTESTDTSTTFTISLPVTL